MRFVFVLCLGMTSASLFAQTTILIPPLPGRTAQDVVSAPRSSTPRSTGDSAAAGVPAQSPDTSADLADAPSATQPPAMQPSTCTQKNGQPCPEWVQEFVGQYPPVDQPERNGQSDHFLTFGNARRVLHPDKRSWILFTMAQAGNVGLYRDCG